MIRISIVMNFINKIIGISIDLDKYAIGNKIYSNKLVLILCIEFNLIF